MGSQFKFSLKLSFKTEKNAMAVFRAVSLETGQRHEKRSKTNMDINKNVVLVKIIAKDASALKASINSYLKLFLLSNNFLEVF